MVFKIGSKRAKVGDVMKNNEGYSLEVIAYENANNVTIRWLDCGTEEVTAAGNISRGMIKYLNKPSVFGVGYLGYGRFVPGEKRLTEGQIRLPTHLHRHWRHVLERALPGVRDVPRYEDAEVCPEWHNFQNFGEWAILQKNHDGVENNGRLWHLDKDILVSGNKLYSPNTCCFAPNEVNAFFTKKDIGNTGYFGVNEIRGKRATYKTGYIARCTVNGIREYLGFYDTPEEAFFVYADAKERAARELAKKWEGIVDDRITNLLYAYEFDRTCMQ